MPLKKGVGDHEDIGVRILTSSKQRAGEVFFPGLGRGKDRFPLHILDLSHLIGGKPLSTSKGLQWLGLCGGGSEIFAQAFPDYPIRN